MLSKDPLQNNADDVRLASRGQNVFLYKFSNNVNFDKMLI